MRTFIITLVSYAIFAALALFAGSADTNSIPHRFYRTVVSTNTEQYAIVDSQKEVVTLYDKADHLIWATNVVMGLQADPVMSERKIWDMQVYKGDLWVNVGRGYAVVDIKTGGLKGFHKDESMKIFIILSALMFCTFVRADIPAYAPMRDWVEKSCTTNTVPKDERVFIGHGSVSDYASIFRYRKGISLRDIIDGTPYKGTTVTILVMRPDGANLKSGGFFRQVKPSETPDFEVKPLDLIWIYTDVLIF